MTSVTPRVYTGRDENERVNVNNVTPKQETWSYHGAAATAAAAAAAIAAAATAIAAAVAAATATAIAAAAIAAAAIATAATAIAAAAVAAAAAATATVGVRTRVPGETVVPPGGSVRQAVPSSVRGGVASEDSGRCFLGKSTQHTNGFSDQ